MLHFHPKLDILNKNLKPIPSLVLDNKLTFKKHIKDKLNKAYFGVGKIKDFVIYCLTILSLLFINLLLGHIWITVMSSMANQIMIRILIR